MHTPIIAVTMTIGIIGAGNVGGTLGTGWAKKGHSILFGVPDLSSPSVKAALERAGASAKAGSVADAGACEVVVLATPWEATQSAIQNAGNLTGKVVLDCTNPLLPDLSGLALGTTTSGGEQVAGWESETILLSKAVDGSLILKRSNSAVGVTGGVIPVIANETVSWSRFAILKSN